MSCLVRVQRLKIKGVDTLCCVKSTIPTPSMVSTLIFSVAIARIGSRAVVGPLVGNYCIRAKPQEGRGVGDRLLAICLRKMSRNKPYPGSGAWREKAASTIAMGRTAT